MQQLLSPILLAARNPRLRRIIIATFLVGLSGSMTFDIGGQFFNQSLDLIQHGTYLDIGMVCARANPWAASVNTLERDHWAFGEVLRPVVFDPMDDPDVLYADECWGPDGSRETHVVYCSGDGVP